MDLLRQLLLVVHLLGFAALFGGMFIQMRSSEKSVNAAMRDGAGTAFLAGLLLVGVIEGGADQVADGFHAKVAVKFVLSLAILVLVMVNLKKKTIPNGLFWGIFGLTVVTVCTAVFWIPAHHF